jgi:hypothetical protein
MDFLLNYINLSGRFLNWILWQSLNNSQSGNFLLFKLSFDVITLLTKKEDASRIEQYKLICLLIVSFVFMKVGTNSVMGIVHSVL